MNFLTLAIIMLCALFMGKTNGQLLYPALRVREIPVIRNGRVDIVRDLVTATPVPQTMFDVRYIGQRI